jgi:hypothetical protein
MKRAVCVVLALCGLGTVGRLVAQESQSPRFETDIRPILKAHCWQCHGEEEELRGRLDTRLVRTLLKGGASGPAIVPGKTGASLLYRRVAAGQMPPGKKKVTGRELQTLAEWIEAGARTARPEPLSPVAGDRFTPEERGHWAFQPVRRPAVPRTRTTASIRNQIDAFLLARLERVGERFSAEADRATLARRLHFDLLGLPPPAELVHRFTADRSPDAYEKLVDELLASPRYGERWGRHWLDVAGYADSDGYAEEDPVRPWAYKYRDYVIRSFNEDLPWDRFLTEQLAGDELVPPPYQDLTGEQAGKLVATGFLRMGPDGTGGSNADANAARNDVVAETIKITTTALLGLSVGCAQCHDHRYEPISQEDYYRFRALLEPAYDWQNWRSPRQRLLNTWSAEQRRRAEEVDRELQTLAGRRTAELQALVLATFERELARLPPPHQPIARAGRAVSHDQRTELQRELIRKHPGLTVDPGSIARFAPEQAAALTAKFEKQSAPLKAGRPLEDQVMCLTEVPGKVPVTRLFARGDFKLPKQEVAPGDLSVLGAAAAVIPSRAPGLPTSGRRLAYARHLTSGRHPLTARVLVNRFWLHHFGRGLVGTPGDFGVMGEKPSHPELLDWLASEFVEGGWRLKRLHRLMVTSTAYRQVSTRRARLDRLDPDNRLLGRMSVRRMEAEVVRDALLAVGGRLVNKLGGPPVPVSPDEAGQIILAVDTRDGAARPTGKVVPLGEEEFRRSVYVQVRRSMPLSVLEPFDLPGLSPNCERRTSSTVATQALVMLNNSFVVEQAGVIGARAEREAGASPAAQVRWLWMAALGRQPEPIELARSLGFLAGEPEEKPQAMPSSTPITRLTHALVASNAFLYVE